jgi:hypothetical protein
MATLYERINDNIGELVFSVAGTDTDNVKYKSILTRFCKEGVRDIVDKQLAVNPKDMHLFTQNIFIRNMGVFGSQANTLTFSEYTLPWKDADGGYKIDNNYVLYVAREYGGIIVPCHEISAEKGLRVTDPESIYFTGTDYRNPVFYRASSKLYVYPTLSDEDEGRASIVKYDEKFNVDSDKVAYFPNHLLYLVVLYSSAKALKLLLNQKRKDYEENYSTPIKTWKALYGDAATLPVLPDFPTDIPDFGDTFSLDYLFPTIDFGSGTAEKETVEKVLSNVWNRIHSEEEVELVGSELSRFNAILAEYEKRLNTMERRAQQVLGKFTAAMQEFQNKYSTVMDVWTRYQASYAKSAEIVSAEIQRLENDYQKNFFPKHYQEKLKKEGSV